MKVNNKNIKFWLMIPVILITILLTIFFPVGEGARLCATVLIFLSLIYVLIMFVILLAEFEEGDIEFEFDLFKSKATLGKDNRVKRFSNLSKNWPYNKINRIDHNVIQKATYFLESLQENCDAFPTGRNSVQIEFDSKDGDYLEFEIFSDRIECLIEKNESN